MDMPMIHRVSFCILSSKLVTSWSPNPETRRAILSWMFLNVQLCGYFFEAPLLQAQFLRFNCFCKAFLELLWCKWYHCWVRTLISLDQIFNIDIVLWINRFFHLPFVSFVPDAPQSLLLFFPRHFVQLQISPLRNETSDREVGCCVFFDAKEETT